MSASSNETVAAIAKVFENQKFHGNHILILRAFLARFVSKHRDNPSTKVQDELRRIYDDIVSKDFTQLENFVIILFELEPYLRITGDLPTWYTLVITDFVDHQDSTKTSSQYTKDFVLACIAVGPEMEDQPERNKASRRFVSELVDEYMVRTEILASPEARDVDVWPRQLRSQDFLKMLITAVGQKQPQFLFQRLERPLQSTTQRYYALQLMAYWLQNQHAHIHRITDTKVLEILLKCLMNDRSTAMISLALQCLVMLLPHIPHTMARSLPRLFLIYSRVLCWEKFSASASRAQKDLVTDELHRQDSDDSDDERFTIDPDWKVVTSVPDAAPDSSPLELLSYFTYLYGLYPLNFMEYIKRPRRYLRQIGFPGVESFDLDQSIIHKRTEHYQDLHILHPDLYRSTPQEELESTRWAKAEPPDVIAECLRLYIGDSSTAPLAPRGFKHVKSTKQRKEEEEKRKREEEKGQAEALERRLILPTQDEIDVFGMDPDGLLQGAERTPSIPSPSSLFSLDGPLPPIVPPRGAQAIPGQQQWVASMDKQFMARRILALRSELNFERFIKQSHAVTISQMKRDRMHANTQQAETGSLLNENKTLKKKLSEALAFNDKLQRETHSRKLHARQSEQQLNDKIRDLKARLEDQEALKADLARADEAVEQLRQLVVETERRELKAKERIEELEHELKEKLAAAPQ